MAIHYALAFGISIIISACESSTATIYFFGDMSICWDFKRTKALWTYFHTKARKAYDYWCYLIRVHSRAFLRMSRYGLLVSPDLPFALSRLFG